MEAVWTIVDNHLALKCGIQILHPNAEEVYAFLNKKNEESIQGISCKSPEEEIPSMRFSRIGCPVSMILENSAANSVSLKIIATRRNDIIDVDIVNGTIIDHCVFNNTWFYLTDGINELQELLEKTGIKNCGVITIRQYLKLVEHISLTHTRFITNNVDSSLFKNPIDENENAPSTLKATLFPYQKTGYLWLKYMLQESQGCILGDEMGLGKTMQVIAVILHFKQVNKVPILVVAPISLLANWKRECEKFAPSLDVWVRHGPSRTGNYRDLMLHDVVVTSYTTVVSDIHMLNMINWELIALDEAQNIKNPYSARTKSCKALRRLRSLAISGTPFENHITDIWSLVDFAIPNILGSIDKYKEEITDDVNGGERIEPILSPLMIRRLVNDVAKDLPTRVVSTQPIQMSEEECCQYTKYLEQIKASTNDENVNLGMLQKLRIYCTHPLAAEESDYWNDPCDSSVKYQRFCEIVTEIVERGEKVIVFTSYKRMFDIFKKDLTCRFGIKVWSINGETPVGERQSIVDTFNNLGTSAALILNPRAAGTGLNITGANHVIHYNLEWNPSLEDQSSARACRRGQQKTVFIYRLFYEGTIDEVVNDRIERKREIASSAIVGNTGRNQDRDDIIRVLKLVPSIKNKSI